MDLGNKYAQNHSNCTGTVTEQNTVFIFLLKAFYTVINKYTKVSSYKKIHISEK